jgi:adenylosuccinate synthase
MRHKKTHPCVDIVLGGQWGSEGKGNVIDYMARERGYAYLLRSGGPNAGHSVMHEGKKVVFYHLPSAALACPKALLVLGSGAVINEKVLAKEMQHVPDSSVMVDWRAVLIEDDDIAWEKAYLRGMNSSTCQGVGHATAQKVLRQREPVLSFGQRPLNQIMTADVSRFLIEQIDLYAPMMLEGTQGTMLSLHHGHYPYVTSRDTTANGLLAEMGIPHKAVARTVMVVRTFPIRVGGPSGPMRNETGWKTIAKTSGIPLETLEKNERTTTTNRPRRVAGIDFEALSWAASVNGADEIALTFVDYLGVDNRGACEFDQFNPRTREFIKNVEEATGCPVTMASTGFGPEFMVRR